MRLRHTIQLLIRSTITAVRPAEKLTVSEWAEKYRYLNNTGSYVGLWDHDKTPYMRENRQIGHCVQLAGI
jgi:phage terminase large subunit GpA-like protein